MAIIGTSGTHQHRTGLWPHTTNQFRFRPAATTNKE